MKSFIILALLLGLASCGKDSKSTKKTTENISFAQLQSKGIYFKEEADKLVVYCISNGVTTTNERLQELNKFKSSIGLDSSKTVSYMIGSRVMQPYEFEMLLNDAIYRLQPDGWRSFGTDTACPDLQLAYLY